MGAAGNGFVDSQADVECSFVLDEAAPSRRSKFIHCRGSRQFTSTLDAYSVARTDLVTRLSRHRVLMQQPRENLLLTQALCTSSSHYLATLPR